MVKKAGKGGSGGGDGYEDDPPPTAGRTTRPPFITAPVADSGLSDKVRSLKILDVDMSELLGGSVVLDASHTTSDYASLPRESERKSPTQSLVSARTGLRRGPAPAVRVRLVR